jgi:glycosyltransferase involved in cell wall biosynthesis
MLAAAPDAVRTRVYRIPASPDTPSFYRALDAFTLPSRYEGFALSALEALATGLPLILTDCPGNDDLKHYGFNALRWSPIGDSSGLAARISGWLDGVAAPNNHRETMVTKLNANDTWKQVLRCYEIQPVASDSERQ